MIVSTADGSFEQLVCEPLLCLTAPLVLKLCVFLTCVIDGPSVQLIELTLFILFFV